MQRESFSGRLGYLLAAAGSAIGLGDIILFPAYVQKHGGGAFLIPFLIFSVLVGFTILVGETALGRKAGGGAYVSFGALGQKWKWAGLFCVLTGSLILSIYIVLTGWAIGYAKIFIFDYSLVKPMATNQTSNVFFKHFIAHPFNAILLPFLAIGITSWIVAAGVRSGLERFTKAVMPCLILFLLILLVYVYSTTPGAFGSIADFIIPQKGLTQGGLLDALSLAFFTYSLGAGCMIIYGSYLSRRENLITSSGAVIGLDLLVAVFVALILFPLAENAGPIKLGPEVIFTQLSDIFSHQIGGIAGQAAGSLFFIFVVLAALTSTISLLEIPVTYFMERFKWSRAKAALFTGLVIFFAGIPSALSFGGEVHFGFSSFSSPWLWNKAENFFDMIMILFMNIGLPLGGLLVCLGIAYRMGWPSFEEEITLGNAGFKHSTTSRLMKLLFTVVTPALIAVITCYKIAPLVRADNIPLHTFLDSIYMEKVRRDPFLAAEVGMHTSAAGWGDISYNDARKEWEISRLMRDNMVRIYNYNHLTGEEKLSYDLYKYQVEKDSVALKYFYYDYPINHMNGLQDQLIEILTKKHPITNLDQAKNYIERVRRLPVFIDTLIAELKIRRNLGITLPSDIADLPIKHIENSLKGAPLDTSLEKHEILKVFIRLIEGVPGLTPTDKQALASQLSDALLFQFKPAYTKLRDYLIESQSQANRLPGLSAFPDGEKCYNWLIRKHTTTEMTADQIYRLGRSEVTRILGEIETIRLEMGFKGSLQEFMEFMRDSSVFYYSAGQNNQYLFDTKAMLEKLRPATDRAFWTQPKSQYEVRPVEPFRQGGSLASYEAGTADFRRPGIYYIDTSLITALPKWQMRPLAFHEVDPGHHRERSSQIENLNLPLFRRFFDITAYSEGWGLYCEWLAVELGGYPTPTDRYGQLAMELHRACRLVVDVGIHARGWSKQQALDTLKVIGPFKAKVNESEVNRYIAAPGQALSYKTGMARIMALRQRAEQELSTDFDIRRFHDAILRNGALPLDVLEKNIVNWLVMEKKRSLLRKNDCRPGEN